MDSHKMKMFLFTVSSLCILGAVVMCILAIWGYVGKEAAWKTVATVGVIMLGCMAFGVANEQLGKSNDYDDD